MYMIGDRVKFNEEIYFKIQNRLMEKGLELSSNNFLVEADLSKTEDRLYVKGILKNGNDKRYKVKPSDVEELELKHWNLFALENFRDFMCLNSKSSMVFRKLIDCDCRKSKINYIDCTADGKMLTYITLDKYLENENYEKGRQSAKPIKIINKILKDNNMDELTQDEIDAVLSALEQKIEADFVVVSGKDISKYYNENNYVKHNGGSLHSSCMRYDKYSRYGVFEIYEDNAKMLILKDRNEDKIYGRALIWELETEDGDKYTLLDRIYCIKNSIVGMFIDYANKNNMLHLKDQTYGRYEFYQNDELVLNCKHKNVFVKLNKEPIDYPKMPYVDTVRLMCLYDKKAYILIDGCTDDNRDGAIRVNNTSGRPGFDSQDDKDAWLDRHEELKSNMLFEEYNLRRSLRWISEER